MKVLLKNVNRIGDIEMTNELKPVPAGKQGKGLRKLSKKVRNKIGFLKDGGKVMAGMKKRSKKKKNMKKRAKAMGGGIMKKRMKRGGKVK